MQLHQTATCPAHLKTPACLPRPLMPAVAALEHVVHHQKCVMAVQMFRHPEERQHRQLQVGGWVVSNLGGLQAGAGSCCTDTPLPHGRCQMLTDYTVPWLPLNPPWPARSA